MSLKLLQRRQLPAAGQRGGTTATNLPPEVAGPYQEPADVPYPRPCVRRLCDLKYHEPLARAASGADVIVSEAIAVHMTRALGSGARSAGRDSTATIMHDIEDYHVTPEQAAQIANAAGARLLVFYHLLPAPDGVLARDVFAQGIDTVRPAGWTIADDGSLYTLPLGSTAVEQSRIGR